MAACGDDAAGVSASITSTSPPVTTDEPTTTDAAAPSDWQPPPRGGYFDYQLGGDYPSSAEVVVVARDWFAGTPADGLYNICYVNAFQTQPPDDSDRPDERDGWPASVVSSFEDPDWAGEFIIDLGTAEQRADAASFVNTMVDTCHKKGFDAVEFDNLDSYSRVDNLPFGQAESLEYAATITAHAHDLGLAVAQKNTAELTRAQALDQVGFDFAVVEECAEFDECRTYKAIYETNVLAIEYSVDGMQQACVQLVGVSPVLRRDRDLVTPDDPGYEFETYCGGRGYG
jgi:hypothetical protein